MSPATRPLTRIALPILVAAASMLLAGLLSQCRFVSDTLLGARANSASAAGCIVQCTQAYNDSIRVESDLHVANVQACGGDLLCQQQEKFRHETAVNRIQAGRRACIDGCHHQGGGSGGR